MNPLIVERETDHESIKSQKALERRDDGYRSARADDRGFIVPFLFKGRPDPI